MGALSGPPAGILTVADPFQQPPCPEVVSCGLPPRFTMPETAMRAILFVLAALVGAGSGVYIAFQGTPVQVAGAMYATALVALILLGLNTP